MGITHGTDGFIVRELTSRCDYNPNQLEAVESELVKRLQKSIVVPKESYLYIEQMYHKHQFCSLEGIEFVTPWSVNQMSSNYCKALLSLVRSVQKQPSFKVLSVHDEFKALPNYMNEVRQTYIDLLAEIADSTMLNAMLSDIAGRIITVEKLNPNLSALIRNSEYSLA